MPENLQQLEIPEQISDPSQAEKAHEDLITQLRQMSNADLTRGVLYGRLDLSILDSLKNDRYALHALKDIFEAKLKLAPPNAEKEIHVLETFIKGINENLEQPKIP